MTIQPGSRTEGKAHLRVVTDRAGALRVPPQYRPPRFPADLVGLDRAAEWLNRLAQRELALVQAPMGYGKTAFCATLFAEAKAAGWRAGWVSFDAEDDGPAATAHIAEAVRLACGEADCGASDMPVADGAAKLAEAIDADDRPLLLVLDDADRLADRGATALLDALLRYPPARLHLLLAGRSAPAVKVDAVERRGMMLRIGGADLALDEAAATAFLSATDAVLDARGAAALHALLEGWPAGLRLAAQRAAALAAPDFGGLVARIDAHLAPLIDALPDDTRVFLQRCAVAPRVDVDLARLLSGDEASGGLLRDLAARGLFVEAEGGGTWYRLHPAFRAMLRARLDRAEPGRAGQLHRAAARHFAAAGLTAEAIEQALAAADFEQAGALVAIAAMPMIESGRVEQASAWIAALPAETIAAVPELARAHAWLAVLRAQGEAGFEAAGDDAPALDLLHGAYAADRLDEAVEACDQLLAAPGELSDFAAAMLRGALAHGALKRGLFGLVHDAVRPLLLRGRGRPLDLPLALAITTKAAAARAQGQLGEAERMLRDAAEGAPEPGLATALVDAALARCGYEREDFDGAAELVARALPLLENAGFQDALLQAYLVAIRVAAGAGQEGRAAALIDRAELIAFERGWTPLKALCIVERARLRLPPTIDPEAVVAIAEEDAAVLDPLSAPGRAFALLAEMRAYEAIAAGDRPRLTRVAALLLQLASSADDAELRTAATLFNILPQLSGRCDKMVELETVRFLNHAATVGFRRTIVDVLDVTGVRAVQNFCSEAYASGCFLALLRLAEPSRRNPALEGGHGAAPGEAFSFLTEREIEILSALNAGESNKEIARTLQLAPETVKWHLKNVMRKLRAGTREEAVLNASTLGLKLIEPGAQR